MQLKKCMAALAQGATSAVCDSSALVGTGARLHKVKVRVARKIRGGECKPFP